MKNAKFYTLVVIILILGAKAWGQEWVYSQEFDYSVDALYFLEPFELSDGRILVSCTNNHINDCGVYVYPIPALMALDSEGTRIAYSEYYKEGFFGSHPLVLENESGETFILMNYSPDHDTCSLNYFQNFDPPIDYCILGLYKLNDNLNIAESYELEIPIDTFEYQGRPWNCGQIDVTSAFVDDDGTIVGAYCKTTSFDYPDPRGYDSTVFFRMDFEGRIINEARYCGEYRWGEDPTLDYRNHHIVKADSLYIYYGFVRDVVAEDGKNLVYLDYDFNIVRSRAFRHSNALHPFDNVYFQNMNVKRSPHGITYLTSVISEMDDHYCSVLYEYDDDVNASGNSVPIKRYAERKTQDYDSPTQSTGVALWEDGTICYAYTLNNGLGLSNDSWIVLEHLTPEFDTIRTLFYGSNDDGVFSRAKGISALSDGGLLLTSWERKLYAWDQGCVNVVKFPAEAFVGIVEAHASGLKVAIAYPNPGKDVLNIRKRLKDARVEVYDMSGRMIYGQEITEDVTSINAEGWPAGTYIWKVYTNQVGPSTLRPDSATAGSVTETESGKWIKK